MCIFCKIANKEINGDIVLENDKFIAFKDINPQAKVHILAIPKQHIENFNEIEPSLMAEMTSFIQEIVKKENLDNGYRLITNIGKFGSQEVLHLHFHILSGEVIGKLVCK